MKQNHKNIEHITEVKKYTSKNPLIRFVIHKFVSDLFSIIKRIKLPDKPMVLDAGCGNGFILRFIRKKFSYSLCGLDISKKTLRYSRKLNLKIPLFQASITKIPFADETFDLVINLQVLEHLYNPIFAVKELKRVSKKYCIIAVPYEPFFRISNLLRLKYVSKLGNYPDHRNHWNRYSFRKFLNKHFRKVSIKNSTIWLIAVCRK